MLLSSTSSQECFTTNVPAFILPSSLRPASTTPRQPLSSYPSRGWAPRPIGPSPSSLPRHASSPSSCPSDDTQDKRIRRRPSSPQNSPLIYLSTSASLRNLMVWMLATVPGLFFCPTPENLAPFGLQRWEIATMSQAAGFSDEQQLVADTWKRVDKLYLDRTFNGQDWFALRQTALKKNYKTTAEVYDGIEKMLEPLGDPYTRFLPPSQYQSLYGLATGSVAGVGVSLFIDPDVGELTVVEVEKGSPAEASGLKSGDRIISIDGQSTKGLLVDDCANLLRGPAGTKVGLVAKAKGSNDVKDLIITRQVIKIQSVEASTANKGLKRVGVIRIRSFSQTTADTVAQELDKLEKQGISAVVIDLRGNPGGFLGGGIDTAKLFLPSYEKIVSVIGKTGIVEEYQTTEEGVETTKPLFLIVDKRSASASEVLSAALKENGRAKLVGEKTFGKGVVQTVEEVGQGCGVSVTIAAYATPNGNNINKKGIEVDIPSTCEASDAAVSCLPDGIF